MVMLAVWAALVLQRLAELQLAQRNARLLRSQGAQEYGAQHYPWMVVLHSLWFLSWAWEGWGRPLSPGWPWMAVLGLLVGQGLRWNSMATLGENWTTRVLVVPHRSRVRRGLYRWFAHPNYCGVILEIASIPLMFGAWRTALLFSIANAVLLRQRMKVENEAWQL